MYVNRSPQQYSNPMGLMSRFGHGSVLTDGGRMGAGAVIYLSSFVIAAYGMPGIALGFLAALAGSAMVSAPLFDRSDLSAPPVLDKWISARIDLVPSDDGVEAAEDLTQESGISSADYVEDAILQEELDVSVDGDEVNTVDEDTDGDVDENLYELIEQLEEEKGDQFSILPVLKTSRVDFFAFLQDGGRILYLPRMRESFECPLCGERVPWDMKQCPSCGITFSRIEEGLEEFLQDDLDEYGRSILPGDIQVRGIAMHVEDGTIVVYGERKKRVESDYISGFSDDFLAGIGAID